MNFDKNELQRKIPGWGADLKPENRPGVPKEKPAPNGTGAHWAKPERQRVDVKIYKTIERNELTPVFGNTCPPKLISGKFRDYAYTLGEGKIRRWVTLLLADRIDMVETIISDVLTGRAQDPINEMGLAVEARERRENSSFKKLGVIAGAGLLGLSAYTLMQRRNFGLRTNGDRTNRTRAA